jgi:DNA (cytosine-5)-methyltransferase 1
MTSLSFDLQVELLNSCVNKNLDLGTELETLGFTYDDLNYRFNPKSLFDFTAPYQNLDNYDFPYNSVPTVSFFSGSGGLDLGFEAAGFQHLAAIEIERLFCETLRANRPRWNVIGPPDHSGDVRKREEIAIALQSLGIRSQFEGVFYGGPPCQPFSIAANQRFAKSGDNFKRIGFTHETYGNLLFDYIWFILAFTPRVFLIENVPGLATIDDGMQMSEAIVLLREAGYTVAKPIILDASDYGVPQYRQRIIICGWRSSRDLNFPMPEKLRVPSMSALEKPLKHLSNHVTRRHEAQSILRYMELGPGERDHLGRVDRLDPFRPSKTVIAGGTKGGGRSHLHPYIPRTLSVRESARLQTFPDEYVFCGSPARQFTQVGNAVPPILAMKLARSIFESIYE